MKKRFAAFLTAFCLMLTSGVLVLPVKAASGLQPLLEEYGSYDFSLFVQGDAMASLYERAQQAGADAEALRAEAAELDKTLKNTYPYLIPYAKKGDYDAVSAGVTDWAITSAADWRAAVEAKHSFEGEGLHLTQNIDMENQAVSPLGNGSVPFKGLLDGHGFTFKNLLVEQDLASSTYAGLIGYAQLGCVVRELGLESGLVRAYGKQTTEAKVGGLMGEGDHVILRHCWSAVTVDSTEGDGNGGQTTSGLARTRGDSVIDGCYCIGTVKGKRYAGTLSGYTQSETKVLNSFAVGTASGAMVSFVRYNADGKVVNVENSYSVGNSGSFCYKNTSVDTSAYELLAEAYSNGELAWKLNRGMVGETPTYYTLEDNKTVFGTAENQVRRITLACEGGETRYLYAVPGTQVEMDYGPHAFYSGDAVIVGNRLTVPERDVTVTVTLGEFDYSELEHLLAVYESVDPRYLQDADAAAALVEAVLGRVAAGYSDGEVLEADVQALEAALQPAEPETLPSVTLAQQAPGAPGYTIGSLQELEFAATHKALFDERDVLYITADITVEAGSPAHDLRGLTASLDGLGHTLRGLCCDGDAWLGNYGGRAVRRLVFEDCHAINQPWQGALLIKEVRGEVLVLEDLQFIGCSASKGDTSNGLAIAVGIQQHFGKTELRRITVKQCTLDRGGAAGNSGFLMGREKNGVLIVEDCILEDNGIVDLYDGLGTGIAFGEVTGTAVMQNVGIFNTEVAGNTAAGVLIGGFKNCDSGTSLGILTAENVYSANNNLIGLVCQRNTTGEARLGNVYSDGRYLLYHQKGLVEPIGEAVTAAESKGGGAYTLNHAGVEKKWEIPAGGTVPVWDTDGKGLPVRVTFRAGGYAMNFYTDTAGRLTNLDEDLFRYACWEGFADPESLKNTVFTEDRTVEGQLLGETVTVMCQNLCVWGGADKKPYMVELVNKYQPDILLLQEGKQDWMDYLTENMKGYSMYYQYRAPNNREACPVAWKTDKFELVEQGHFWLSDTPEVSSKDWDSSTYRITTWVVLRSKATGEYLIASSFHLDHVGAVAREKGGALVYDRLLEVRERYPGSMFFTAADFNCREGSPAYLSMTRENLADMRYEAVETSFRPTYGNGLSPDWSDVALKGRGDFMMTDVSSAKVMEFQVLEEIFGITEDSEGTRLSDHNGLLATVVSKRDPRAVCTHQWAVTDLGNGTHQRSCTAGCGYSEAVAHSARYTKKNSSSHGSCCAYCEAEWEEPCTHEITGTYPTCTAAGELTYFCTQCKNSVTETPPAVAHQYEWDAAKSDYLCCCGAAYEGMDVNGDQAVDTADAVVILQYLIGQNVSMDRMAADCQRNRQITVADAVKLLRALST